MRERKSEKKLVIRIIITGADAEEPDEPEYWTEEVVSRTYSAHLTMSEQ